MLASFLLFYPLLASSNVILIIFATNSVNMETTNKNSSNNLLNWGIFLVSTAVMVAMLIFIDEWFWLALPFSLTYLAKALNAI